MAVMVLIKPLVVSKSVWSTSPTQTKQFMQLLSETQYKKLNDQNAYELASFLGVCMPVWLGCKQCYNSCQTENLTFVILLLLPVCSCNMRRKGRDFGSTFSCVYASIFVLITHTKFLNEINIAVLYWSQDCVHLLIQIVLLVLSTWLIIDMLDNEPAESQRNDRKQREKSASRLDISHQGNLKKKKVYFVPHNNQYALSCHQVPTTSQKNIARLFFFQWTSHVL